MLTYHREKKLRARENKLSPINTSENETLPRENLIMSARSDRIISVKAFGNTDLGGCVHGKHEVGFVVGYVEVRSGV